MRWIAGLLLVCAAVLKAAELVSEPTASLTSQLGPFFLPLQIGVELVVGLMVLSGAYWHSFRWFIAALFTAFAGYSLYLATNGAASCGCFGSLQINPWWTFSLDVVVVLGLLVSCLHEEAKPSGVADELRIPGTMLNTRKITAFAMASAVIVTALLVRYVNNQTAVADDGLAIAEDLVILEPDRWIGKEFPIADFIDIDLSRGEWTVLFHRHDCATCQKVLPQYEQLAVTGQRVALIEVPPYGASGLHASACQLARLSDSRDWFIQTPVKLQLLNGIVTAAEYHEH